MEMIYYCFARIFTVRHFFLRIDWSERDPREISKYSHLSIELFPHYQIVWS